jgi:hypothetical protein
MPKKTISVGVKAALVGACAVIIAAILSAVVPLFCKESPSVSQSVNNSPGTIQTGKDVIVQQLINPLNASTLTKDYDAKFEGMTKKRAQAASAILEYLSKGKWSLVANNTDALDDVLGFFDTMGYDEEHGSLNADVLHEYFCDDIMAYYQASADYIAEVQQKEGATAFAHIKPLFDLMVKTEANKEHTKTTEISFSNDDLVKYFKSEINSVNLKEDK